MTVNSRHRLGEPGWAIVAAVGILYTIGLLCIYATEAAAGGVPANTIKQIVYLAAGIAVSIVIVRLGFGFFSRHAYLIFALALLSLVPLVLARYVPMDSVIPHRRGAHRWIKLPMFQLQPSEFMKVAHVIGLAAYLRYRRTYRTFWGLMIPLAASLVPMFLILLEPDLGTALLMWPVLLIMLYAAGAKARHLAMVDCVSAAMIPLFWVQLKPYQRSRIAGVLLQSETLRDRIIAHPQRYELLSTPRQAREWEVGTGMQLVRSKAALGSGGVTGQGWGRGTYVQYNFLPDKHNDFIFAIIGHQWGLAGCLLVLACFVIIVLAGMEIASATNEPFARLLAVGIVALMASQAAINIGMTIGLMPVTGMTLPFVSYGGSSLLTNFIGVSLLLSVARYRPYLLADRPFEFGRNADREKLVRPSPAYRQH